MENSQFSDTEIRVLLCDDQLIVGEALKRLLADLPNVVFRHVDHGAALLPALLDFKPNVVLQDLILPETSGIELLKLVRNDPRFRDLPVILLSTNDDPKTKFDAFASGASDYIVKFPEKFELVGRISYHSRAYLNLKAREEAQAALQQKSRLESLGNLAAGIAHEINTPLQYISANLSYIESAIRNIEGSIQDRQEVSEAIEETIEGVGQISLIVRAMKAFAHPGKQEKVSVSLNEIVQDIEILSKNEWKEFSTMELHLDPALPLVSCAPGSIAQVLLNLVVNSAQAIQELNRSSEYQGRIEIFSRQSGEMVEIEVKDNGGGIPDSIQERVFEPFFTTKEVGIGSGQGLSLSRTTIVEGHSGQLDFITRNGEGTSFFIRLPLLRSASDALSER